MTVGLRNGDTGHGTADKNGGPAPVLVLGLGNLLLSDDGVGLRLLESLRKDGLGEGYGHDGAVEYVDGGTQGLALLGCLEGRESVLVLDAVNFGAAPGTVHVLKGKVVEQLRARRASTAHEGGAIQLFEVANVLRLGWYELALVGIEPEKVRTGIGLSPSVEQSMGEAVKRAKEIIEEMVHTYVPGNSR